MIFNAAKELGQLSKLKVMHQEAAKAVNYLPQKNKYFWSDHNFIFF